MLAASLLALILAAAPASDFVMRPSGAWHGIRFQEAREFSTTGTVTRIEMSLYNRGDDKSEAGMSRADLKVLLDRVVAELTPEDKPPAVEKRKVRSGGVEYVQRWPKAVPSAELTWGLTGETADFVRLTLDAAPAKKRATDGPVAGNVAKAKVKANVRKNAEGDVWIDNVPMVDQGQKGYCAAAVSERVLRYYGHPIDEHQIAQMAGTKAEGGTQVSEMIETVKAVASKCRLGFSPIVSMSGSMGDIRKDLETYNKAAKALKRPQLKYDDFLDGNAFMVPRMRAAMESEVVLAQRAKDSRFKRFLAGVKTQTDNGVPVFWGVTLGMFPEPGVPQSGGGHMRLIIGYNAKTHEILYTDTWGAGHELKRMAEDRAFAITHDAFFLKPL